MHAFLREAPAVAKSDMRKDVARLSAQLGLDLSEIDLTLNEGEAKSEKQSKNI